MGGGSKGASEDRYSGAMENLIQLSELMQQASALLAAEDEDAGGAQEATAPLKSRASFLTVVALGNMVRPQHHDIVVVACIAIAIAIAGLKCSRA